MTRFPVGERIRENRKARGLTQAALAGEAGISTSYLNLIENDKRMIGGAILKRIAERLEVDLTQLSGSGDTALAAEVTEIVRSLALAKADDADARRFVARSPEWAQAFVALYRRYQDSSRAALTLSDRLSQDPALMELSHAVLTQISSIRSFAEILVAYPELSGDERLRFSNIIASQSDRLGMSAREMIKLLDGGGPEPRPTSPQNEVADFINFHDNYLPDIERAAGTLRDELGGDGALTTSALTERLRRDYGVEIRRSGRGGVELEENGGQNGPGRPLVLDEWALEPSTRFRLARRLVEFEMGGRIETLTQDVRLSSDEARAQARRALASYGAGALLFPYEPFIEAAEAYRYDIDRLGLRFGASFEQVAHRLTTMRRPGKEGIPFSFLRADPAGNISKPFSIPGLRMPRLGGACPLWAIYGAFTSPDRTVAQLAEMPSGERYLFIARRLSKRTAAFGGTPVTFSVMLGCDASYGERIVYGDGFASDRGTLATPVGFNCRSCSRRDCSQRAQTDILSGA